MGALDFSGRQQLYYQLYNILFQDIISGRYQVGSLIPAESELMKTYQVSRATARKASNVGRDSPLDSLTSLISA